MMTDPTGGSRKSHTLSEVADALGGLGYRHVRRLVQTGQLRARNVAALGEKPCWRVTPQALAAIKKRRGT